MMGTGARTGRFAEKGRMVRGAVLRLALMALLACAACMAGLALAAAAPQQAQAAASKVTFCLYTPSDTAVYAWKATNADSGYPTNDGYTQIAEGQRIAAGTLLFNHSRNLSGMTVSGLPNFNGRRDLESGTGANWSLHADGYRMTEWYRCRETGNYISADYGNHTWKEVCQALGWTDFSKDFTLHLDMIAYKADHVALNPNGGTASTASKSFDSGNYSATATGSDAEFYFAQYEWSSPVYSNSYHDVMTLDGLQPTRTGYTFAGWYDAASGGTQIWTADGTAVPDGTWVDASYHWAKPGNGDTSTYSQNGGGNSYTVYAHWSLVDYTVSYDLKGGSMAGTAKTSYNVETEDFTLPTPTRAGWTFAGWSGTGVSGTQMSVTVPKGSTGDRSYTAHWTRDSYAISYHANGGTGAVDDTVVPAQAKGKLATEGFERSGRTLAGWNTKADGTGTSYALGQWVRPSSDMDLYAVWADGNAFVNSWEPYGGVKVFKRDASDGRGLADATFAVLKVGTDDPDSVLEGLEGLLAVLPDHASDNVVDTFMNVSGMPLTRAATVTTGSDGYGQTASDALEEGWYLVFETYPPSGYGRDATVYAFQVTEPGQLVERGFAGSQGDAAQMTFSDEPDGTERSGAQVKKTDEDGEPLAGAVFSFYTKSSLESAVSAYSSHEDDEDDFGNLLYTDATDYAFKTVRPVATAKSGSDGIAKTNDRAFALSTEVVAVETQAPTGYSIVPYSFEDWSGTQTVTSGKWEYSYNDITDALTWEDSESKTGEAVIEAEKTVTNGELSMGEYSFQLLDSDGNVLQTVANGVTEEEASGGAGYLVKPDGDGDDAAKAAIKAAYASFDLDSSLVTVTAGSDHDWQATFAGTPLFTDYWDETDDGEYIELAEVAATSPIAAKVTSTDHPATVRFAPIQYGKDDIGKTFTYKVREVAGSGNDGIVYDDHTATYEVTVKDTDEDGNDTGSLVCEPELTSKKGSDVFSNSEKTGAVVLKAHKTLATPSGEREVGLDGGEFTFRVTDANGEQVYTEPGGTEEDSEPLEAANDANGDVEFPALTYGRDDIGKTYTYVISEDTGSRDGVTYTDSAVRATVTVADAGGEDLACTVKYSNAYCGSSEDDMTAALDDWYGEHGDLGDTVFISGSSAEGFWVDHSSDGQSDHWSLSNGVLVRDFTHDGSAGGDEIALAGGTAAAFANTYRASGLVQVEAEKTLEGRDLAAGEFEFELVDGNGDVVATGTNGGLTAYYDADGTMTLQAAGDSEAVLTPVRYDEDDVGEHTYLLRERDTGDSSVEYDAHEVVVTVDVEDDGDGTLTCTASYDGAGAAAGGAADRSDVVDAIEAWYAGQGATGVTVVDSGTAFVATGDGGLLARWDYADGTATLAETEGSGAFAEENVGASVDVSAGDGSVPEFVNTAKAVEMPFTGMPGGAPMWLALAAVLAGCAWAIHRSRRKAAAEAAGAEETGDER